MTKGNSPFGAGVVCIYRSLGMLSLKVVNATICAFFCIHTKYGEVLCGTGVNSIGHISIRSDHEIKTIHVDGACFCAFVCRL